MMTPADDRFVRVHELRSIVGLSTSTIWRLERAGQFPKRRRLSLAAAGWRLSEVHQWMAERQEASHGPSIAAARPGAEVPTGGENRRERRAR